MPHHGISHGASSAASSPPLNQHRPDGASPTAAAELEGLLIRGRREAACEHAMAHGMWADALLLSSHMDADTWRMVMSRFATHTYSPGSPLRTLYSLFADSGDRIFDGWQPASSTPDGLGKWRRNLAMMLANPLVGDTEVIASLGDQLAGRCARATTQPDPLRPCQLACLISTPYYSILILNHSPPTHRSHHALTTQCHRRTLLA